MSGPVELLSSRGRSMTKSDELKALADRVLDGPPSRELDLACESALRGLMARTTYPGRYSATEWAAATAEKLRARAALFCQEAAK